MRHKAVARGFVNEARSKIVSFLMGKDLDINERHPTSWEKTIRLFLATRSTAPG
jgi:hypothetical protein